MASPPAADPELSVIQWAIGGLAAALLAGYGHLLTITGRLSGRVDSVVSNATDVEVEAARTFATREDVQELGRRFEARMDQHEKRMTDLVMGRKP